MCPLGSFSVNYDSSLSEFSTSLLSVLPSSTLHIRLPHSVGGFPSLQVLSETDFSTLCEGGPVFAVRIPSGVSCWSSLLIGQEDHVFLCEGWEQCVENVALQPTIGKWFLFWILRIHEILGPCFLKADAFTAPQFWWVWSLLKPGFFNVALCSGHRRQHFLLPYCGSCSLQNCCEWRVLGCHWDWRDSTEHLRVPVSFLPPHYPSPQEGWTPEKRREQVLHVYVDSLWRKAGDGKPSFQTCLLKRLKSSASTGCASASASATHVWRLWSLPASYLSP